MARMDSSIRTAENPWQSHDTLLGVRLGDPQNGVVVARRCGLVLDQAVSPSLCQKRVMESSSIQMIDALQTISKLNEELSEVEFQLHRLLVDREIADLVHLDALEERLSGIDTVLGHFTEVLKNKEHIQTRLQSCSTENSLQVEVSCHKHLVGILQSINPTLRSLPASTAHIKWAQSFDLSQSTLDQKLSTAVQSLVQCKDIHQCHQKMLRLHNPET